TSRSPRLTTPTGRPRSSMTGAADRPRPVSAAVTSGTVASACTDMGLADIRSAARTASSLRTGAACACAIVMGTSPGRGGSFPRLFASGVPDARRIFGSADGGGQPAAVVALQPLLHAGQFPGPLVAGALAGEGVVEEVQGLQQVAELADALLQAGALV